jgi:hypothetical protein
VRLGRVATCTRRCEEAAPYTHGPDGQRNQEGGSGRAADGRDKAVAGSSLEPWVGAVAGRAFVGGRVLELPLLAGSGVVENKVLAVVSIVPVAAYSVADHGAYLGSLEEAQRVATSSYRVVEAAPALEKRMPG